MSQCWWCHKPNKLYAFNLCLSCYRWFLRAQESPPLRCTMCEKVISRKNKDKMLCAECNHIITKANQPLHRITHMEDKYAYVTKFLQSLTVQNLNPELQLTAIFKFKHRRLATILCDRFYHKKTLQEIGTKYSVSREYIRQCEDKAISLLTAYLNGATI